MVSPPLLQLVHERTDGIPLCIEEFVATLQSQQCIHSDNGQLTLDHNSDADKLPVSIKALLQNKLDPLIHAKETAQLAAVIGRQFAINYWLPQRAKVKNKCNMIWLRSLRRGCCSNSGESMAILAFLNMP